jgi:nicotinamidase-related amidase
MESFKLDSRRTAHLCLDMQKMFAEDTEWRTPWMDRVLPVIAEIAERHQKRTIFTRFIPPARAEDAEGSWRKYFSRWRSFTLDEIDPELLELVEPLKRLVPPAKVLDKAGFSPFYGTALCAELRRLEIDTLVVTGAETDVCVLAAVLSAIDLGFFVVLVKDGLCSSSDETHDALLTLYGNRFSQQLRLVDSEDLIAAWPESS